MDPDNECVVFFLSVCQTTALLKRENLRLLMLLSLLRTQPSFLLVLIHYSSNAQALGVKLLSSC